MGWVLFVLLTSTMPEPTGPEEILMKFVLGAHKNAAGAVNLKGRPLCLIQPGKVGVRVVCTLCKLSLVPGVPVGRCRGGGCGWQGSAFLWGLVDTSLTLDECQCPHS